jgi:RHS repeat-associated protein
VGNALSYEDVRLAYNLRNRLSSTTKGASTRSYLYNALGQLMKASGGAGGTVLFVHDEAGHLVGEYTATGAVIQETIWMGDIPVATIRGGATPQIYYVHADLLGTPIRVTESASNRLRWQWKSDPFGTLAASENPEALGAFVYNLRLPGQLFDGQAGLHQNYFRDYSPAIGRYVESDPIGLAGGTNPYTYVAGNPVSYLDPLGLDKVIYLPPTDPSYKAALNFPDDPAVCMIFSHGSNVTVNRMAAPQLNEALQSRCKPKQPVEIHACDTGKGEDSIAEKLAKLRGTKVTAPDAKVWTTWWNTEMKTPYPPLAPSGSRLNSIPNLAKPGQWREFLP